MAAAPQSTRVAAAMVAALAAERATEDAVREAQQTGALGLREATERAAQITRRCDERVRQVHDSCAAALVQRISELMGQSDTAHESTARLHDARLDALLDRVAAWLTSSK